MIEVERLALAGIPVNSAKFFRPGPRFERRPALPDRVRGIERVVLVLWASEQVKLDESRDLAQLRVAAEPNLLEIPLGSLPDPETIHGNEHLLLLSMVAALPSSANITSA